MSDRRNSGTVEPTISGKAGALHAGASKLMSRKSLMKKTLQVGGATLMSRMLGVTRDVLLSRFLGLGVVSDAFITAFKIPNFFRHIFAEGALSAAFIPQVVKMVHEKRQEDVASLITSVFLFFEGIVALMCVGVFVFGDRVTWVLAPSFSAQQHAATVPMVRILFPLLLFFSSNALFAGALQAVNWFAIPAFGQVIINLGWIVSLLICIKYNFSVITFCYCVIAASAVQLSVQIFAFHKAGLRFAWPTRSGLTHLRAVLKRFIPGLAGVSIQEVNLLLDMTIASAFAVGSITIIYQANRFMQIPLGVFAVALSTTLLPYFSRVALYAPRRLEYYLLEVSKFVTWVIVPLMLFLMFFSNEIFSLLMLKGKGTPEQIIMAQNTLMIYCSGLIFFSLNRVLSSIFYSLHDTRTPVRATLAQGAVKLSGDVISIYWGGIYMMAASTVAAGVVLTGVYLYQLRRVHNFRFFPAPFFEFVGRYLIHLICALSLFFVTNYLFFAKIIGSPWELFFTQGLGFWMFTISLFCFTMGFLFITKDFFKVKVYFLNR